MRRRTIAAVASFLAVYSFAPECDPAASKPPGRDPLAGFHHALSQLERGERSRLTIIQIGDSHTEGDRFSGHLRALMQQRFGNGGRGMLPPGVPYKDYTPQDVEATQTGSWQVISSNKRDYMRLPYGLSGFVVRSLRAGSAISLTAGEGAAFDEAEISYYRQPGGGSFEVKVDGTVVGTIDTEGPVYELAFAAVTLPVRSRQIVLRSTDNGTVDLANWSTYRKGAGVVLTSHGFSGAQIGIMSRWDWHVVAAELRRLNPALIILAFGTNEGDAPRSKLVQYAATFENRLRVIQKLLPQASIVVVGAPDVNVLPKYCNLSTGLGGPRCRPLAPDEAEQYDALLANKDRRLCRWHTPAGTDQVREVQRQISADLGVLFWDWSTVQGGLCGATRWTEQGLAWPDRVHLRKDGSRISAEKLYDALLKGYAKH